ncbi:MAG: hypothetical protein LBT00_06365 [Spirochaetaceae bacterium]|jgi:uncharacterized protein YukE|nr:hypothetical protein [Spirochaetaceae bacterium]
MEKSNGLDAILEAELALLVAVSTAQTKVKEAVEKREWAAFETYTRQIEEAAARFAELEAARQNSADAETPQIAALKRCLKAEINKIRWTGEAVARYLEEQRALTGAFIEAIYPEKRGAIYSRSGKHAAADMRSLVLNQTY